MILCRYDFEIQHTKGRENVVADALSRIELPASESGPDEELDQMLLNIKPDIFGSETAARKRSQRRLTEISVVEETFAPSISAVDSTVGQLNDCLLYTSPSPRDGLLSRMPSSA